MPTTYCLAWAHQPTDPSGCRSWWPPPPPPVGEQRLDHRELPGLQRQSRRPLQGSHRLFVQRCGVQCALPAELQGGRRRAGEPGPVGSDLRRLNPESQCRPELAGRQVGGVHPGGAVQWVVRSGLGLLAAAADCAVSKKKPTLYLIDGHALAYRAYFALTRGGDVSRFITSSGEPTAGTFGFISVLLKLLETEAPEYLAVTFDTGSTFRDEIYPEYKGTRAKMPEDLRTQIGRSE